MNRFLRHCAKGLQPCTPRRPNLLVLQHRFVNIGRPRRHGNYKRQPLFLRFSVNNLNGWRGQIPLIRAFSINPEKDYYKILGLTDDATLAQIKAAFYKLAKKWHPDLFQQAPENELTEARAMYREIQEAHEVLSDNNKKNEYDMQRKYGSTGRTTYSQGGQGFGSQGQGFGSQGGHEDFWKQQQEMHERMEEMKRRNPEMWKQHEQVRAFMNRLWKGLFFLIGLQLVFGILFRNSGNQDQLGQRSQQQRGAQGGYYDQQEQESSDSRFGEPLGTRRFENQGQSWSEAPSFGSTSYPKKIFILGDELPSMYLNPANETLDERPTYRSSKPIAGTGMYFVLYHGDDEWRISLSQYINHASKCYARVEDSAYNPAEISGTWRVFDRTYNRYEYDSNFHLSTSPTGESQWL